MTKTFCDICGQPIGDEVSKSVLPSPLGPTAMYPGFEKYQSTLIRMHDVLPNILDLHKHCAAKLLTAISDTIRRVKRESTTADSTVDEKKEET